MASVILTKCLILPTPMNLVTIYLMMTADTLNNYFEETTGCDLIWIGIGNGSTDAWVTNPAVFWTVVVSMTALNIQMEPILSPTH